MAALLPAPATPCYVRSVPLTRLTLGIAVVALSAASAGCRHKNKSPAEAYRRFSEAVTAGDGGALWDALDQESRWAFMTVQKWHREAYDIVLSNYPEGPEREKERRRFEQRRHRVQRARAVHRATLAPTLLPMFQPLVLPERQHPAGAGRRSRGGRARLGAADRAVARQGRRLGLRRPGRSAPRTTRTARYHDLEVVRASAADYERAAARAGK